MENDSCLGPDVDCYNVAPVHLGIGAIVSQKSYLCTAGHDIENPDFALTAGSIIIGRSAWVAADCFIGPGIVIMDHAVVGARAVVTKSMPENSVSAGNPAVVLKYRDKA